MKKLILIVISLSLVGFIAWQNRVNLLIAGLPMLLEITDPVSAEDPVEWSVGPDRPMTNIDDRPPNIILILADDMGFNDLSLYNGGAGDGSLMTPNIDALGQEGVIFDNGYAANAVCAPSRASILTGRYSTRFGFEFTPFPAIGVTIAKWIQEIDDPELKAFIDTELASEMDDIADKGMPSEQVTLAEVLKEAGYYTAHIGKWHLGQIEGSHPLDQGFMDSLMMMGGLYLPEDDPKVVNSKIDHSIDKMVWATGRFAASFNKSGLYEPKSYLTDYYTDNSMQVIENNQHRPFFLYLSHWAIHNPLQSLKEDYEKHIDHGNHNLGVYSGMIEALDRSIGRIVKRLEDLDLSENTLIIFTSDNGGASYIELPDVNKPYRGWKLTHFEGGMHIPFMAKWPSKIKKGTRFKHPIHHIDIFHTAIAAAGADLPTDRKLDGVDLLPYVQGRNNEIPHKTLFWREGHHQTVLHNGWKLIKSGRINKKWLFNLNEDPLEKINLAKKEVEKINELENLLAAHNDEQIGPLWPSVIDSPQLIDKHGGQDYEEGDEYIYWPN
ncbi:MAG: sulfatase [Gammaproteobacteria bacterium]|nr:sulfatase [Gammaproteobacteria bacterium]